ncbi:MAG: hypothetical protein Q9190_000809 [Brigantiaea leucoxantha]
MASSEDFIALARRRDISPNDLYSTGLADHVVDDLGTTFQDLIEEISSSEGSESQTYSNSHGNFSKSLGSRNTSKTSLSMESELDADEPNMALSDASIERDSIDFESNDNESHMNDSARESWSDASTDPGSDEIEEEEQWNDWSSEVDLRSEPDFDSDKSISDKRSLDYDSNASNPSTSASMKPIRSNSSSDFDSLKSSSSGEYGSDSEESSSGGSSNGGQQFEDLIGARRKPGAKLDRTGNKHPEPRAQHGTIQVYEIVSGKAQQVFRFSAHFSHVLLDSPPVFHPTASLVIWPLHQGQMLFADFRQKTYYTRQLRTSAQRACFVFMKCRFSPNGEYLHIAALEARIPKESKGNFARKGAGEKDPLHLTLQISTHRMSKLKVSRTPPRLLHRMSIPLKSVASINASRLPYELTWTPAYLYFTSSDCMLNVIRIPLFPVKAKLLQSGKPQIPQKPIYLPASAHERKVQFCPSTSSSNDASVMVFIGSWLSRAATRDGSRRGRQVVQPAIGFYLDEEKDLGGWKDMPGIGEETRQKASGGILQRKVEKFDLKDDCDIVPYLY